MKNFHNYILVFDSLQRKNIPATLVDKGFAGNLFVVTKYSNLFSSFTFFLNSFHMAFCNECCDNTMITKLSKTVYCKIELPKVANGNWRMLHLQIGESCKAFARNSQERCSAWVAATKYEHSHEKIHCRYIQKPLTLSLL